MHKCYCGGILIAVDEMHTNEYVCTRCGNSFTEEELLSDEDEESGFNKEDM